MGRCAHWSGPVPGAKFVWLDKPVYSPPKSLRAINSKAFGNISCWVKEKQVELEKLQLAELSE